eukprot:TRINITY_DN2499_c0_g1_i1.p1 TRINITY_DN2499_c0_g1~~TRINITY_DN2499_c0_g1_i1.p1  ORF type:complete len:478 (+),score=116.17 TRINITY_DN2499_c0_g1_i1:87-1436(+)
MRAGGGDESPLTVVAVSGPPPKRLRLRCRDAALVKPEAGTYNLDPIERRTQSASSVAAESDAGSGNLRMTARRHARNRLSSGASAIPDGAVSAQLSLMGADDCPVLAGGRHSHASATASSGGLTSTAAGSADDYLAHADTSPAETAAAMPDTAPAPVPPPQLVSEHGSDHSDQPSEHRAPQRKPSPVPNQSRGRGGGRGRARGGGSGGGRRGRVSKMAELRQELQRISEAGLQPWQERIIAEYVAERGQEHLGGLDVDGLTEPELASLVAKLRKPPKPATKRATRAPAKRRVVESSSDDGSSDESDQLSSSSSEPTVQPRKRARASKAPAPADGGMTAWLVFLQKTLASPSAASKQWHGCRKGIIAHVRQNRIEAKKLRACNPQPAYLKVWSSVTELCILTASLQGAPPGPPSAHALAFTLWQELCQELPDGFDAILEICNRFLSAPAP